MTGDYLARRSEIRLTEFLEIAKSDIGWLAAHLVKDLSVSCHLLMVPIVAPPTKAAFLWPHFPSQENAALYEPIFYVIAFTQIPM